jgi:DNA mismatch endonuclease, patch repair protein
MDTLSPAERSRRMGLVRQKDTAPELIVRRLLHRMGCRFRLHRRDLPGRPDIVLPRHRLAIFVHGCFWHRHDDPACTLARLPKTRLDFWLPKFEANQARDAAAEAALAAAGWRVLVFWQCQLRDAAALEARLAEALGKAR